jgi:hypothetical protein
LGAVDFNYWGFHGHAVKFVRCYKGSVVKSHRCSQFHGLYYGIFEQYHKSSDAEWAVSPIVLGKTNKLSTNVQFISVFINQQTTKRKPAMFQAGLFFFGSGGWI